MNPDLVASLLLLTPIWAALAWAVPAAICELQRRRQPLPEPELLAFQSELSQLVARLGVVLQSGRTSSGVPFARLCAGEPSRPGAVAVEAFLAPHRWVFLVDRDVVSGAVFRNVGSLEAGHANHRVASVRGGPSALRVECAAGTLSAAAVFDLMRYGIGLGRSPRVERDGAGLGGDSGSPFAIGL